MIPIIIAFARNSPSSRRSALLPQPAAAKACGMGMGRAAALLLAATLCYGPSASTAETDSLPRQPWINGGYGGLGWDAKRRDGMPDPSLAPRQTGGALLTPCSAKPCTNHPGRTYCPSDPSPGQCDRVSHPPCPGCPPAPPGPPPVPSPPPVPGPVCSSGNISSNHICPGPNYHACLNATARAMGYCNTSLSTEARIEDLIGRLHQQDQIAMISPQVRKRLTAFVCAPFSEF